MAESLRFEMGLSELPGVEKLACRDPARVVMKADWRCVGVCISLNEGMYKIVGADRREYGPVTGDQIREWVAQGRANAQTIARFEEGPWKPLATFPEFSPLFGIPTPGSVPPLAGQAQPLIGAHALPQSNNWAIAGLIFGILGLFCCPVAGSVLSVVFSAIGLSQIRRAPESYTTDRIIPIAGLILGIIGLVIFPVRFNWNFSPGKFWHFPQF